MCFENEFKMKMAITLNRDTDHIIFFVFFSIFVLFVYLYVSKFNLSSGRHILFTDIHSFEILKNKISVEISLQHGDNSHKTDTKSIDKVIIYIGRNLMLD